MVLQQTFKFSLSSKRVQTALCLAVVLLTSWFTYFQEFDKPNQFIWDEQYHVVSAQKYLNNTFYMTVHPPLGKMLIALGQYIFYPNQPNDHFLDVHVAESMPDTGLYLKGYRTVPIILAWLTAPLLFFVFLLLTRSALTSTFLSFLYIFDNALLAHLRAAMLEGPLLFFVVSSILFWLLIFEWKDRKRLFAFISFVLGVCIAGALATKVLALVLVLLVPAAMIKLFPRWELITRCLLYCFSGFLIMYVSVWYVHINIARNINSNLETSGYHWVSDAYRERIDAGSYTSLLTVPIAIRDHIWKMRQQSPMEPLNLCLKGHQGSPVVFWPFGARAVRYWTYELALDDGHRYLYLQSNPVVWFAGLLGVLLSGVYLLSSLFITGKRKSERTFYIATFFVLYMSYMIGISTIDRMMYLYHYFIPLLFSFILFGLTVMEVRSIGRWKIDEHMREIVLGVLAVFIFLVFLFYSPLTYFQPLTDEAFQRRNIFPLWDLRCKDCEHSHMWWSPPVKNS